MTKPTTTTSTTQQAPQSKPQAYVWGFTAPRDANTPFPPYSLRAAEELLFQAKNPPPQLEYFTEDLFWEALASREHVKAAVAVAGTLYRALEASKSGHLELASALCLLLHELDYYVVMTGERIRLATLKGLGQEVK